MSPSMARVIFVGPKKVVGGVLFIFGAMMGSGEVAVVLTKGEEMKMCWLTSKSCRSRRDQRVQSRKAMGACLPRTLTFIGGSDDAKSLFCPSCFHGASARKCNIENSQRTPRTMCRRKMSSRRAKTSGEAVRRGEALGRRPEGFHEGGVPEGSEDWAGD